MRERLFFLLGQVVQHNLLHARGSLWDLGGPHGGAWTTCVKDVPGSLASHASGGNQTKVLNYLLSWLRSLAVLDRQTCPVPNEMEESGGVGRYVFLGPMENRSGQP